MDIRRGKIYILFFVLFIIFLALGGFFLTNYLVKDIDSNEKQKPSKEVIKEENNLKLVQNEEYIYFDNEEVISENLEISFKNININLKSEDASYITNKLNEEVSNYKKDLKYISEEEITEEDQEKIIYKDDNIYSTNYVKYTRYFYNNYASVLVEKYSFDCFNGSENLNNEAYTFDTKTGKLLSKKEIMTIYNTNIDKLKMEIQDRLEKKEEEDIDIIETLKNLDNDDNYALYINKSGYLTLSYLVKSMKNDYNDVIIFN